MLAIDPQASDEHMTTVSVRDLSLQGASIIDDVATSRQPVLVRSHRNVVGRIIALSDEALIPQVASGQQRPAAAGRTSRLTEVGLREFLRNLRGILDGLEESGALVLTRQGKPVAALVPAGGSGSDSQQFLAAPPPRLPQREPRANREEPATAEVPAHRPASLNPPNLVEPAAREAGEGVEAGSPIRVARPAGRDIRDVFISHAGEDKEAVARPLAEALKRLGLSVWFDEYELLVGDRLSTTIDRGLATSRFGVVIISPAFMRKPWPQRELAALVARETSEGETVILPVWHEVSKEQVLAFSPPLADVVAINTVHGIDAVVDALVPAVNRRREHLDPAGRPLAAVDL